MCVSVLLHSGSLCGLYSGIHPEVHKVNPLLLCMKCLSSDQNLLTQRIHMKEGTYEDTKLLSYVFYEKANMPFLSDKIS